MGGRAGRGRLEGRGSAQPVSHLGMFGGGASQSKGGRGEARRGKEGLEVFAQKERIAAWDLHGGCMGLGMGNTVAVCTCQGYRA